MKPFNKSKLCSEAYDFITEGIESKMSENQRNFYTGKRVILFFHKLENQFDRETANFIMNAVSKKLPF